MSSDWRNYVGKPAATKPAANQPTTAFDYNAYKQQQAAKIPTIPTTQTAALAAAAAPVAVDPKQQAFAPIAAAQQQYLANVLRGAAGNPSAMPLVMKAQQDIALQTQEWNKAWDEAAARNAQAAQQQQYYDQQASTYQQQTEAFRQQAQAMEAANLQQQQNFLTSQQNTANQFQQTLAASQQQQAELMQQQQAAYDAQLQAQREAAAQQAEQQRIALEQQRAIADSVVPLPQQATAGFDFSGSRARRKRSSSQLQSAAPSYSAKSGLQIPR